MARTARTPLTEQLFKEITGLWRRGHAAAAGRVLGAVLGTVKDIFILSQAGHEFESMGAFELSEACVGAAIRLEPSSISLLLQRAFLIWRATAVPPDREQLVGSAPKESGFSGLFWGAGRLPAARIELERAVRGSRDLNRDDLHAVMGFYFETGEFDLAQELLEHSLKTSPDSGAVRAYLAQLKLWRGDFRSAKKFAAAALEREPDSTLGARCLAGSYVMSRELDRARREIDKILERDGDDFEANLWLAEIHLRRGDSRGCRRALRRAKQIEGAPAALEILEIITGSGTAKKLEPFQRRVFGWMGGNRGNIDIFSSKGCLARTPKRPFVDYKRYNRESPDAAITLISEFHLWQVFFRSPSAVLGDMTRLARAFPGEPQPLAHKAELLLWLGRNQESIDVLNSVREMPGARIWWMIARGGAAMMEGRLEEAMSLLEESGPRGGLPRSIAPWRGECLRRMGDYEGALGEFGKIQAHFPFHITVWINIALCRFKQHREDEAAKLFHAIRRQAPAFAQAAIGPVSPRAWTPRVMERILETMLAMSKGNRSAVCPTAAGSDGVIRAVRLRGC